MGYSSVLVKNTFLFSILNLFYSTIFKKLYGRFFLLGLSGCPEHRICWVFKPLLVGIDRVALLITVNEQSRPNRNRCLQQTLISLFASGNSYHQN